MNLEKAKQEFEKYAKQYDFSNKKIERKFGHSYRVMENAGKIAESIDLSKEEVELARLIGLLHDIGHFEEIKLKEENIKIDHGDYGVEILIKDNYIRKFIGEEKYDNIILKAIKNHNKYKIEEGLSEQQLLYAKIIRDADKLDIFYEGAEMFWNTEDERKKIEESKITGEVWNEFNKKITIDRSKRQTKADDIISFISLIFDVNFNYTFETIQDKKYIEKILNKFKFEDEDTLNKINEIKELVTVKK